MTEGNSAAPDHTTCAIVGGGPAGIVLGLLLARAGIEVTVLEKHADFLRDFRGDTVHPATLGLLDDLGLFEQFDALPHSKLRRAYFPGRDGSDVFADFDRLPVRHPYIAMVPQWDLLDLLADTAAAEPTFTLRREHTVTAVTRRGGRVTGVAYTSPDGEGRLSADLVVGCDGRWSTVRRSVGLPVREIPVRFDVWWYRLPTDRPLPESLLPRVRDGRVAIGIPRRGYVQVAALGPKGTDAEVRSRGIGAFRRDAAILFPELDDGVDALSSMDDVKHLDVRLERLRRWHANNVLCIGDAAHAMSPVGGVGINLAIQDAVVTARLLAGPLARGELDRPGGSRVLARVRRRRLPAVAVIQTLQRILHARLIMPALGGDPLDPPAWLLRLVRVVPAVTALPAFLIGVGVRPERAPSWARRPDGSPRVRRATR
ncbi:FAD-dependent oxidoreductase [Microbacterium invictum]|uniref:FAD-dependent oxidoreductase n=1 Tax=Microbacterium invictum TaxID=515415 RepID=A0ABZ0VA86_9MICO|nr:FAD-dependent oxidoreductase [Microbacterium invictum]WQB70054.1 FAD-dependent oxidoreductase [Microbacterium invictum]